MKNALVLIDGRIGNGKTLYLVYKATRLQKPIYSNFLLDLPNFHALHIYDFPDLPYNINVFIDEGYVLSDSRSSMSKLNKYMSYIYNQSRKKGMNIFITTQLASAIDFRFRDQATHTVRCIKRKSGFIYRIKNQTNGIIRRKFLSNEKAIPYFKIYDTLEIVRPESMRDFEAELKIGNPERMFQEVEKVALLVKPLLNETTHNSVEFALAKLGYSKSYERFVYTLLTEQVKNGKA